MLPKIRIGMHAGKAASQKQALRRRLAVSDGPSLEDLPHRGSLGAWYAGLAARPGRTADPQLLQLPGEVVGKHAQDRGCCGDRSACGFERP